MPISAQITVRPWPLWKRAIGPLLLAASVAVAVCAGIGWLGWLAFVLQLAAATADGLLLRATVRVVREATETLAAMTAGERLAEELKKKPMTGDIRTRPSEIIRETLDREIQE